MMFLGTERVLSATEKEMRRRMEAAAIHLVNSVREMISTPSRTVGSRTTRTGRTVKVLGPRGSDRSKPGEPPHKDYGTLRSSITWEVTVTPDRITARVGSPLAYSRYLELGTRKMAARPFLRRALAEQGDAIRAIIENGQTPQ